jgi:hypothetical protein
MELEACVRGGYTVSTYQPSDLDALKMGERKPGPHKQPHIAMTVSKATCRKYVDLPDMLEVSCKQQR